MSRAVLTLISAPCLFLLVTAAFAEPDLTLNPPASPWKMVDSGPTATLWKATRDKQIPGLELLLALPKNHYYVGEVIPAKVTFVNHSKDPYFLWFGNVDRNGPVADMEFRAQDSTGNDVPSIESVSGMGGLGGFSDLGTWSVDLNANQWFTLDKPGNYTIFVWSSRVQRGAFKNFGLNNPPTCLVSDRVQLTIDPRPPEIEKQIIDDFNSTLPELSNDKFNYYTVADKLRGILDQLRYLNTDAAREVLLHVLDSPNCNESETSDGILAAPDPVGMASHILDEVAAGKLTASEQVCSVYACEKVGKDRSKPELFKAAENELLAAIPKGSGKKPSALLLTKFSINPEDPSLRAEVVKRQLELSPEQAITVLNGLGDKGGSDFVPMAVKLCDDRFYGKQAMEFLAKEAPDQAITLLMADAKLPAPNLRWDTNSLAIAPRSVPKLDEPLRKFIEADTLRYIALFGSPNLLPDVIKYYNAHLNGACEIQTNALKYWIRVDPKSGLEALSEALRSREGNCYKWLLADVLDKQWTDAAKPLLCKALDDDDMEVVTGAYRLLLRHGDSADIDKCIDALFEIAKRKLQSPYEDMAENEARSLVQEDSGDNFPLLTPAQKERLRRLIPPPK